MWSVGTFLYSSLIEQPQELDEELIKDFETPLLILFIWVWSFSWEKCFITRPGDFFGLSWLQVSQPTFAQ